MNARFGFILALAAQPGLVACAPPSTTTVQVHLPSAIDFSDGCQQSDADAIVRKCGADDVELKVNASGEITLLPSLNADYDASVCVLEYIKQSGTTKFGFVGNEKFVTPEEGQ